MFTVFTRLYPAQLKVLKTASVHFDTYKTVLDSAKLETYGITADDISAVQQVEVQCALEDGTVITNQTVYVVKIGHTLYVDNLTTDTTGIYAVETNA